MTSCTAKLKICKNARFVDMSRDSRDFITMMSNLEKASQAVMSLPTKERAALAHALIHSLDDCVDANIEEAWDREMDKRLDRVERGETTDRDAFEVLDEIRSKYVQAD